MPKLRTVIRLISIAMCVSVAMPAFAESAPVYDADTMPQQFEGIPDQGQEVPPPAPGQESAYVPSQQPAADQPVPVVSSGSVDQRMRRIEQQLHNMQGNDTTARLESLQDQVQTLRGQVEQLTHDLQQAQSQQKSMYTDLDKRLSSGKAVKSEPASDTVAATDKTATETPASDTVAANTETDNEAPGLSPSNKHKVKAKAAVVAKADASKATVDQPNVAEEQQIYQTAYNYIKAKKYDDAVTALQGMLKKYPSGQFAANAHYWLGELYGLMNKHDEALTEFSTVTKTFSDSPRVSDAQLKIGLILASQSKWSTAKSAFKTVINHYPGTASARLASEQLKQIKQAGH